MLPPRAPPSLLISTSVPARPLPSSSDHHSPSNSPFRYVHIQEKQQHPLAVAADDVDHPLSGSSRLAGSPTSPCSPLPLKDDAPPPSPPVRLPALPALPPPLPSQPRGRPQGFRIPDRLKPWLGIGSWAVTSIGFLLAIAFWKNEVFTGT